MNGQRIELDSLSANSFEQLVRALCFRFLGAGGTVYPTGPDAGRDFTIEGKIKGYESRAWDGYLVVQAKYRELCNGPDNARWLLQQLANEKRAYADQTRGRRLPKYFIIATNVRLSGTDGKGPGGLQRAGGLSKVTTELNQWKSDLGIEDFDVWSADKIKDLLQDAEEVRRAFAAWLTPSDVLADLLKALELQSSEFDRSLRRALVNNLRRDQYATLKDAGSVSDPKIRASQVFVDLPFSQIGGNEPRYLPQPNIVASIVIRARERFSTDRPSPARGRKSEGNRIVVLGGPGQGKSTIATFIAQLFRSFLILQDPVASNDDVCQELAPETIRRAKGENISVDIPRRYPVFVSLPKFADFVTSSRSQGRTTASLLTYIAITLAESSDGKVGNEELRSWLSAYPWIVVLDGLDEVPPSGERAAVIEGISAFMTEVNDAVGDVLVVVTTRPQGYNRDLDSSSWEHWELTELTAERALHYAKALGEARYPEDRGRRNEVLDKLSHATAESATARLMVSPLQVTILYLIIDTGGTASTARWALFNDYYETLRKRERAKGGKLQEVLEANWTFIGPIHQRAGLLLQAMSEVEGGAGAALSRQRFEEIVRSYLANQGFLDHNLKTRVDELTDVALNRLVLLSAREEGFIRFDVRSLQEFMAAAALTSGEAGQVETRLLHIAGIAHWRHTFLIAASRCFAEDAFHHRRSAIAGIARTLDSFIADKAAANGPNLALEMLHDGLAVDHPNIRRVLARHAAELIALGEIYGSRLQVLWEEGLIDITMDAIRPHLHECQASSGGEAWRVLIDGLQIRPELLALVKANWPRSENHAFAILRGFGEFPNEISLAEWISNLQLRSFEQTLDFAEDMDSERPGGLNRWTTVMLPGLAGVELKTVDVKLDGSSFHAQIVSVRNKAFFAAMLREAARFQDFPFLRPLILFALTPTRDTLTEALEGIARMPDIEVAKRFSFYMPWPLATIVDAVENSEDAAGAARRAGSGAFGGWLEWSKAETRWRKSGLVPDDFNVTSHRDMPFTKEISITGAPGLTHVFTKGSPSRRTLEELVRLWSSLSSSDVRRAIANDASYIIAGFIEPEHMKTIDLGTLLDILSDATEDVDVETLAVLWEYAKHDDTHVVALAKISENSISRTGDNIHADIESVANRASSMPSHRGLLHLFINFVAASDPARIHTLPSIDSAILATTPSDSLQVRISALTLRLAYSEDKRWSDLVGELLLFSKVASRHNFAELLDVIMEGGFFDDGTKTDMLVALVKEMEDKLNPMTTFPRSHLKAVLDRRRSHLRKRAVWVDALELPLDAFIAGC